MARIDRHCGSPTNANEDLSRPGNRHAAGGFVALSRFSAFSAGWLLSGAKKGELSGGLKQSANFATGHLRNLLILRTREIGDSPRREPQAYFAPESNYTSTRKAGQPKAAR